MRHACSLVPFHRSAHPRRRFLQALGAACAAFGGHGLAHALAGGLGLQDPDPQSPWASVGSLHNGNALFSAVAVGRQHVITAAHIVAGAQPARVVFRLATGNGFSSAAASIHLHPAYKGQNTQANAPGDPTVHNDLAILRLAHSLPASVEVSAIFTGDLRGRTLTLVSHGGSTTLITVGENRADAVFPDAFGQPATYLFDHDGPDLSTNRLGPAVPVNGTLGAQREATLVNGDSGSAAFVPFDGRWWLAGINTFSLSVGGAGPGRFGSAAGGVVLASQMGWLREVLALPPG